MTNDVDIGIPQRLCHLPLVMDVMRRTGLLQIIDQAVRDAPQQGVDRRLRVGDPVESEVMDRKSWTGH